MGLILQTSACNVGELICSGLEQVMMLLMYYSTLVSVLFPRIGASFNSQNDMDMRWSACLILSALHIVLDVSKDCLFFDIVSLLNMASRFYESEC